VNKVEILNKHSISNGPVDNNPRAIVLATEALAAMEEYAKHRNAWNNIDFPCPESINGECAEYYLVKVRGYSRPTMAMYLEDEDGNAGWYENYFAKIVKEVVGWKNLD